MGRVPGWVGEDAGLVCYSILYSTRSYITIECTTVYWALFDGRSGPCPEHRHKKQTVILPTSRSRRSEGMDPYSSPDIVPNDIIVVSFVFPFRLSLRTAGKYMQLAGRLVSVRALAATG